MHQHHWTYQLLTIISSLNSEIVGTYSNHANQVLQAICLVHPSPHVQNLVSKNWDPLSLESLMYLSKPTRLAEVSGAPNGTSLAVRHPALLLRCRSRCRGGRGRQWRPLGWAVLPGIGGLAARKNPGARPKSRQPSVTDLCISNRTPCIYKFYIMCQHNCIYI